MRWLLAACLLSGCGSLAARSAHAQPFYEAGLYERAAQALAPLPREGGKDRLLALYERGMILHAARRWADSNAALLEAGRLAESIELIGLAESAGTVVTNEKFADYRGEDYERVLCHTLAAVNFLGLGDPAGALVECRRAEEVHKKIRAVRGSEDRLNPFALYLSGLCYELSGQPNDAYIDYRACWELAPAFPPLEDHLLSISKRLGMAQEHAEWARRFGREARGAPAGTGEAVVLFEAGLAPRKGPGGPLGLLPRLLPRPSAAAAGRLACDGAPAADTVVLNDVGAWAAATLKEREALLLAKRAAVVAAREVVAHQVEERHGSFWGWMTRLVLHPMEGPDLRSWRSLPGTFQACRVRLPAGRRDLLLQPVDASGAPSDDPVAFPGVEVPEGGVVVLVARSVR